jgi:hypothetical protein
MTSESKPEKDWRLLEQLVANFERVLAPLNAVIKSPDRLMDHDSKHPREVDVSIRYTLGSVPILITVECRNRDRVEDAIWIEQLAEKKRALRANATIAVSTSGFGQPAQRKAKRCCIELRHVGSIRDADVERWFQTVFVTVSYLTYEALTLGIVWPDGKFPEGVPSAMDFKLADVWSSPVFLEGPERKAVSLSDLMAGGWDHLQPPDLPPVGGSTKRFICITPEHTDGLFHRLEGKDHKVEKVELAVEIRHFKETVLPQIVREYARPGDKVFAYAGQGRLTTGLQKPIDFVIIKKPGSNRLTLTYGDEGPWWKRKRKKK